MPRPAAAESYDVSPDGTTYTFHLRQDGAWSDGQPVTAAQFAYSWKRLLDPALHAEYAPLFADAGITGVQALDDSTLKIQLSQPFGAFPDVAALWVGAPLRQDIVTEDPDGWSKDPSTYIGNGPFVMTEWIPGDHVTLTSNTKYTAHFNWPAPTLTRVTITMDPSAEAEYAAYQSGKRDWALVPDADVNATLNDPVLSKQARQYTELTTFWIQMNDAHAPLNDVRVRRALSQAVDRSALVRDLATGVSQPTTSIIPPGMPGFQAGLGQNIGFDPANARALLSQAGFGAGENSPKLAFSFPDTPADLERARYLHDQWATNLGWDIQLSGTDEDSFQRALTSGNYDLAFGGWAADYPDPRDWIAPVLGCKAAYNRFGYCNPDLDQLLARADLSGSIDDRLKLYAQAQTQLIQDLPVAPLFVRGRLALVKPWVQSVDGGPLPVTPYDDFPGSLFLDRVQILPH